MQYVIDYSTVVVINSVLSFDVHTSSVIKITFCGIQMIALYYLKLSSASKCRIFEIFPKTNGDKVEFDRLKIAIIFIIALLTALIKSMTF